MKLPNALLVSGDAEVDYLDANSVRIDSESNIATMQGSVRLDRTQYGQLTGILSNPSKDVLEQIEWSTRSFNARIGFDVLHVAIADALQTPKSMLAEATFVLYPGEDPQGKPDRNPLLRMIHDFLKQQHRLKMGRLFFRAGTTPLTDGQIVQDIARGKCLADPRAQVVSDGIVIPCIDVHYPLRFDLIEDRKLEAGLLGFDRGIVEEIQPRVPRGKRTLPPKGYRITAGKFSIGKGRRGVLHEDLVDMKTLAVQDAAKNGASKIWDGLRTAGIQHDRQLEVVNEGWKDVDLSTLGAKVQIYPAPSEVRSSVSISVPPMDFHRAGLTVDHWLKQNGSVQNDRIVRGTLEALHQQSMWGLLVGPSGSRTIPAEEHVPHQVMQLDKAVQLYARHGGTSSPQYPATSLGEFLRHVGNHHQRAALFCRELPPAKALRQLLLQGVRLIFTDNVSGTPGKVYLTNNQLQHCKSLARDGLEIYLVRPTRIRKLWNDLFIDVKCLERVQRSDVRIGCYGASAEHSEIMLEQGAFPEALRAWKKEHPHVALVTGGSTSGAMGYMNRTATQLGITTIGIANEMNDQEIADDGMDGVMMFDADGFEARQGLMAQITTNPLVGPGAQGTGYEAMLELVLRKTGKTCITPVPLIDPMASQRSGGHLWEPILDLQQRFNEEIALPNGKKITLSRSPYCEATCALVESYLDAEQIHSSFMQNPFDAWQRWQVPEAMIKASLFRTVRDSEQTGLPMPPFLTKAVERFCG